ncbi:hypothetical protein BDZ89DRAFT_1119353 [Hymenopellis radicata]|nr:hypothetical protein BDZ89DRAFT_1119353 [Hymenopellis radicata]
MYRFRLVAGRRLRLSLLEKNARFQSNDAPQKPKAKPRIASDIRTTNEPLSQQSTAHPIQTERNSGGAPHPEPQSETAPNPDSGETDKRAIINQDVDNERQREPQPDVVVAKAKAKPGVFSMPSPLRSVWAREPSWSMTRLVLLLTERTRQPS